MPSQPASQPDRLGVPRPERRRYPPLSRFGFRLPRRARAWRAGLDALTACLALLLVAPLAVAQNDTTAPTLVSAEAVGTALTLTYDEALAGTSVSSTALGVGVNGSFRGSGGGVVSGMTVTLTLASAVSESDTVTVTYTASKAGPSFRIRDGSGNEAADLLDHPVRTDFTAPALQSATVEGAELVLTYDEALSGSAPAAGAYTVTVAGSNRGVSGVALSGMAVTVTLASAVGEGEAVTVSYVAANAGGNPVQDGAGNEAPDLTNQAVTHRDTTAPTLVSAEAVGTALTLTYDEALAGTSVSSTALGVGVNGSFRGSGGGVVSGMTVTLTLASAVSESDTVTVTYTASKAGPSFRIRDGSGNEAADLLDHPVRTDFTAPALQSATVEGAELVLTYDEALDTASRPAAGDFTVTVAGSPRTVNSVGVSGMAVTLALASAVTAGQTVTVSYTKGTNPIRDGTGNDAANLINQAVTHQDVTPPVLVSATAQGTELTLTYNEALLTTGVLPSAFTVTVNGSNVSVTGSGFSNALPNSIIIGLGSAVTAGQTVTVSYVAANTVGQEIRDLSGNKAADLTNQNVNTYPPATIVLVRIVSRESHDSDSDGSFDTYIRGDKILVDVAFSEPVEVGGDRNVRLRLDVGADDTNLQNSRKTADLDSVRRGGRTLRFAFEVKYNADVDPDGVWVQTDAANTVLFTPGTATITAAEGGDAADLTKRGLPTRGGMLEGGERARVDGRVTSVPGPRPSSATVDGSALTLTFDKNLDGSVDTDELKYYLFVNGAGLIDGGRGGVYQSPVEISVNGATLTLTLNTPARAGETVTVSYRPARAGGMLKGADGHRAPAFHELAVTNNTAGVAGPLPWRALAAGTTLKLTFTGALDETSRPAGSAFEVIASDRDYDHRAIPGTGTATVSGKAVTVTLAAAVRADEHVMVSYAKPASAPLQGGDGNAVLAFGHFRVETVNDAVPPELSDRAAGQTGTNEARVVLYFDEELDASSVPATGDFQVIREAPSPKLTWTPASVTIAGNAVVLSLTGTNVALAGGNVVSVRWTPGTNKIQDAAGNAWGDAPAAGIRHEIAVDAVNKPVLQSAAVDGAHLTLTYDHSLNPAAVPPPGAFALHHTLEAGETAADRAAYGIVDVDAVAVEGAEAVLLLNFPVFPCSAAPTVSYDKTNPPHLQSLAGQQADAIAHEAVTNSRADRCARALVSGGSGSSGQGGAGRSVALGFDRTLDRSKAIGAPMFSLAGASAPAVEGVAYTADATGVVLTLDRALARGEAVTAGYRRPPRAPGLWDTAGNQIADFSGVAVAAGDGGDAPSVTGVEVVSDAGGDDTYGLGETIRVRLTFSEAVNVTGAPRLSIDMDPAEWGEKRAVYEGGGGAAELTFVYEVVEPNVSTEGIAVLADTLELSGGTIRSAATGTDAALGHPGLAHDPAHKVDSGRAANRPATGAPVIEGTARVGETLTASTAEIADADGLSGAAFAFQWVSSDGGADADIAGATDPGYTLADADEGRTVTVRARFTDDAGHEETRTSAATEAVTPARPPLTAAFEDVPSEHGGKGSEFSFELRFSEDFPGRLDYKVLRDEALRATNGRVTDAKRAAAGQNQRWTITVRPRSSDDVTVTLTATADCGAAGAICTPDGRPLSNSPSAAVSGQSNMPATGAPAITGEARVGETLTASAADIEDADGLSSATFAFQWVSSDADIAGATGASYTLADADEGSAIRVRARFTDDAGHEETLTSAATEAVAPARPPLTASFNGVPAEHGGRGSEFSFELRFSEDFPGSLAYKVLRDEALRATNGRVTGARRAEKGQNQRWIITVRPRSSEALTVSLAATVDCGAAGAICTPDGRPLSSANQATVAGPVGISVADARVEEDEGAVLAFAVTLSRAASRTLTVDYATSDGSAQAGVDYTAASGTLTFEAGESTKTIEVAVLDDSHDEGEETLTLTLSSASSGLLTDGEATGTIENRDPLPRALLARFGRTAAVHVVEHVEERLQAPREPGFRGQFAGREVRRGAERDFALSFLNQLGGLAGVSPLGGSAHGPMAGSRGGGFDTVGSLGMAGLAGGGMGMPGAAGTSRTSAGMMGAGTGAMGAGMPGGAGTMDAPGPMSAAAGTDGGLLGGGLQSMGLGGDSLLTGSAFAMNRETRGGILSFWSRGARSHFAGQEGTLGLSGDVRTTMFGADYARGPVVAGLSLSHSRGLGEYAGVASGQVLSSVTGLYPWLGYQVSERVTVWGVGGYGAGGMLLTPQGQAALESGLSMKMAAAGTRGELVAGGASGFELAFKADALWVGTAIDGVDGPAGRLKATEAAVTRFRTGLEGSRAYTLAGRLSLTPSVEVGLRHDGGDAETGAGMDVGAGLVVSDSSTGLAVDVRVRTLLVHQAEGFRERGVAFSVSYNPTPSTPLGFSAKVAPSWGGQATGGAEALWGRETMAAAAHGGFAAGNRLDGEMGYGLPLGCRFVGTPRVGFSASKYGRDYRFGYGLGVLEQGNVKFELGVDAQRRESPMQGGASNGLLGRATLGW